MKHVDPSAAAAPEGVAEKKQLSQDQRNIMEIHRRKCFSKDFGVH